tara:strand:+ start:8635 stop:8865 length:231 start_codon:yes stop_codon:yes gene_type:complete
MYSNYENRIVKHECMCIEICREEQENSEGKIRLYWTLRDENRNIILITRTYEDMILEMMIRTCEYENEMPLLKRRN